MKGSIVAGFIQAWAFAFHAQSFWLLYGSSVHPAASIVGMLIPAARGDDIWFQPTFSVMEFAVGAVDETVNDIA